MRCACAGCPTPSRRKPPKAPCSADGPLTCDLSVTYGSARDGRRPRVQGARRPDAPVPARPAVRPRGADAHRARVGGGDVALRRDEAPEGPGGGRPGRHATVGPGEVALPQRGADPRGATPGGGEKRTNGPRAARPRPQPSREETRG